MIAKNRRAVWLCASLALVLIIIFLGLKCRNTFAEMRKTYAEDLPQAYSITPVDSALFGPKLMQRIKVDVVLQSKLRKPFSFLTIDERYALVLSELNLVGSATIRQA